MISYTNLPETSGVWGAACFLAITEEFGTTDGEGPAQDLRGSSESRPFVIRYAGNPRDGKLLELDFKVSMRGRPIEDPQSKGQPPSITLSNLKLVSFPDPPAKDLGPTPPSSGAMGGVSHWKSFWIGVAATAVVSLATAQAILLMRRLKKLRAEGEMRRIASMDT